MAACSPQPPDPLPYRHLGKWGACGGILRNQPAQRVRVLLSPLPSLTDGEVWQEVWEPLSSPFLFSYNETLIAGNWLLITLLTY